MLFKLEKLVIKSPHCRGKKFEHRDPSINWHVSHTLQVPRPSLRQKASPTGLPLRESELACRPSAVRVYISILEVFL